MLNNSQVSARRRATTVLASMMVTVLLATGAYAQSAGISGFTPIGDYVVEIDGQDQESAQIFGAQQSRSLLILSSELPAPLLIDLANGNVAALQLLKVAQRDNGTVDLLPNPVARPYGLYSIDGSRIVFEVEGRRVAVKPKPVLVGNRAADEIIDYDPNYGSKRDIYTTSPELIAKLRQKTDTVRVRIYFGTWCPFCSEMVPRVLKIAEELNGSSILFEYYGLPRQINEDAEARAMNISGVPTGIVYRGGKEIGRISGNSWRSPEQALLDILGG